MMLADISTPRSLLGVDFSKGSIMLAFPPLANETSILLPGNWPTVRINYVTPHWWQQLVQLINPAGAVLVWEACNYSLFAAAFTIIQAYRPAAQVWTVNSQMTQHYRESFVSTTKTDEMDARALALIGCDIVNGKHVRNVRQFIFPTDLAVHRLRLYVNTYMRLKKDYTRTQNRISSLGHTLYPSFAGSQTWLRAVRLGFISPRQVRHLASMQPPHKHYAPKTLSHLKRLAKKLPDYDGDECILEAIRGLDRTLQIIEEELESVLEKIRSLINGPPFELVTKRWRTLPYNSDIYIAAFHVASNGRVLEYTKNQFRAAVGASPNIGYSGTTSKRMGNRLGYKPAKWSLFMWTFGLLNNQSPDNIVRTYYEQGRTFAAARNKLSRVLWGVARNNRLDNHM